jgi:hypothetical protein
MADDETPIEMHRKVARYHADAARQTGRGFIRASRAEIAKVLTAEADMISARRARRKEQAFSE